MIRAQHSRPHQWLLFRYLDWSMRRRFHRVRLGGFDGLDTWLRDPAHFPLIIYGNHQTWWDGLVEQLLWRRYGLDFYLMMEEKNLRRFPYFSKCGVFGIDLESKSGRAEGLLYAARLLRSAPGGSRRALFIYPHGRLLHPFEDWPPFQGGLTELRRLAKTAWTLPLCKRIVYAKQMVPDILLEAGQPLPPGGNADPDSLQERLKQTDAALHRRALRDWEGDPAGYIELRRGPKHLRGQT